MLNKSFEVTVNTKVKSTKRLRFNAIVKKIRVFFLKKLISSELSLKLSQEFNQLLRNAQIPLKLRISAIFNADLKTLTIFPYHAVKGTK